MKPHLLDPLRGSRIFRLPLVKTFPYVFQVLRSDNDISYSSAAFYQTIHLGRRQSTTLLPLLTLRDYIISKVVLSTNPNGNTKRKSCWVVMIFGIESRLAFCSCEDFGGVGIWMELTSNSGPYSDVTFYNGILFAPCNSRFVDAWDFNRDPP
ncbi:hypothetical protein NL676_032369 [Syzygium grande]|nr:hypothetical protein NL676_032369 [Syzygium grande]